MKVKRRQKSIVFLSVIFVMFFALSLVNFTVKQARAEGVSATFVQTDKATGAAWEGVYGKQGYVVIGNKGLGYYSNMYDGNDGKTEIVSTTWKYNQAFTATNATPKDSAPISRWDVGATVWGSNNTASSSKINQPGTNEILKDARLHNGWNGVDAATNIARGAYKDVNVMFTLKTDDEIFVTVNVIDWSSKVSETNAITLAVFNSTRKVPADVSKGNVIQQYTGNENAVPLATAKVTAQTTYATFKLAGAGDYQIVAYYDNATNSTDSPVTPMFTGFFFDSKLAEEATARFVSTTTEYGVDWQNSPYGTNGYIVLGGDSKFYSNLYVDNVSDRMPATVSSDELTAIGRHHGDANKYLTVEGKVISSYAPVDQWAVCSQVWGTLPESWAGPAIASSLYKPNSTESTAARFNSGWASVPANDASIIMHKRNEGELYVTLYVNNIGGVDDVTDITVLKGAKLVPHSIATTFEEFYQLETLEKTTVTKVKSYVTFKLTGTGYFQFVATKGENGKQSPMPTAMFFDNEDPTTAKINEASLTLDGTIGLNFYTKIPAAYENAKMKFEYSDGTFEYIDKPVAESDGTYKFTARFAAKNYADNVTATLYNGETAICTPKTYSVKEYCDYVLANAANYDEKLVTLCDSLADYGKIASDYFSSETTASGEVSLKAENLAAYKATKTGTLPAAVKNFALRLESGTDIRIYVTSVNGITAKVGEDSLSSGKDGYGEYFEIANISASKLCTAFDITISDGTNTATLTVSAYSYAYAALKEYENGSETDKKLALVAEAVYNYGEAAKNYFTK